MGQSEGSHLGGRSGEIDDPVQAPLLLSSNHKDRSCFGQGQSDLYTRHITENEIDIGARPISAVESLAIMGRNTCIGLCFGQCC